MNYIILSRLQKNGTIFLVFLCILLGVMAASFSFYQIKQEELQMLSRGLYDPHPTTFTINDDQQTIDWRELHTSSPFTVFIELDGPYRGFFYKKNTYVPPLISGRFFQENDFYSGKKRVVVGQKVDQDIIDGIQQEGYEMIGVMGASYESQIDHIVLYNIDAIEQGNPLRSTVYVLNSRDPSISVEGSIPFHTTNIQAHLLDRNAMGALRFLDTEHFQLMIHGLFIILFASLNFLMIYYWLNQKKSEIHILWQMGISMNHPFRRYMIQFFCLASTSYWLVGLMSYGWPVTSLMNSQIRFMHIRHVLMGYGLMLLISGLSIVLVYVRLRKQIRERGINE